MADFGVTTDFTNGTTAVATEVNQNFEDIEDVLNGNRDSYAQVPALVPIGAVVAWLKTFASADSGNTDGIGATENVLIDTGQNFETTVLVGMVVHNTSDNTFANVTVVDSDTQLTLDADIMDDGENYTIYKTPKLPDGWVECDGTAISDADSPYNGVATPDLIGKSGTERFLRGQIDSGGTGGSETHAHSLTQTTSGAAQDQAVDENTTGTFSTLPSYYEVVWVMRIK